MRRKLTKKPVDLFYCCRRGCSHKLVVELCCTSCDMTQPIAFMQISLYRVTEVYKIIYLCWRDSCAVKCKTFAHRMQAIDNLSQRGRNCCQLLPPGIWTNFWHSVLSYSVQYCRLLWTMISSCIGCCWFSNWSKVMQLLLLVHSAHSFCCIQTMPEYSIFLLFDYKLLWRACRVGR